MNPSSASPLTVALMMLLQMHNVVGQCGMGQFLDGGNCFDCIDGELDFDLSVSPPLPMGCDCPSPLMENVLDDGNVECLEVSAPTSMPVESPTVLPTIVPSFMESGGGPSPQPSIEPTTIEPSLPPIIISPVLPLPTIAPVPLLPPPTAAPILQTCPADSTLMKIDYVSSTGALDCVPSCIITLFVKFAGSIGYNIGGC